jgi:hypothetical protein
MGMFDDVKCKYPLPDPPRGNDFQTKSFGDGVTGGFMENYTITKEGKLVFHKVVYEMVPEEERPYWGKPEWKKNPLMQICGSMKSVPMGDEVMDYHGIINIYTLSDEEWFEYSIEFTNGKVTNAERLYREFG